MEIILGFMGKEDKFLICSINRRHIGVSDDDRLSGMRKSLRRHEITEGVRFVLNSLGVLDIVEELTSIPDDLSLSKRRRMQDVKE